MRLPQSPLLPAAAALAVTVAGHLLVQAVAIGFPSGRTNYAAPDPIPGMAMVGADLQIVLRAGEAWRAEVGSHAAVAAWARSHDRWGRVFPYPPIVVRLLAPLSLLREIDALRVWGLLFLLCYPAALLLYLRAAHPGLREQQGGALFLALLTFALSAAMLLQLERGNFDWFVAAVYLVGLALLARGRDLAAGAVLGLAVSLKVYPVVVLPVLLVSRRWRALAGAATALALVVLVTGPGNNLEWARALGAERVDWLEVRTWHTTLANALGWAFPRIDAGLASKLGLGAWALLLAALLGTLLLARRTGRPPDAAIAGAWAIPFMFMVPATAASYTLFALLPLLFAAGEDWAARPDRRPALLAVGVLVGLCQTPIVAWTLRSGPSFLVPVFSLSVLALGGLGVWLAARAPQDGRSSSPTT